LFTPRNSHGPWGFHVHPLCLTNPLPSMVLTKIKSSSIHRPQKIINPITGDVPTVTSSLIFSIRARPARYLRDTLNRKRLRTLPSYGGISPSRLRFSTPAQQAEPSPPPARARRAPPPPPALPYPTDQKKMPGRFDHWGARLQTGDELASVPGARVRHKRNAVRGDE
jgi:hypothetical protein